MYSAVLMLALTAGSETADFGGRNRCNGGGSCHGAVVGTCSATTSAGCSSSCGGGLRLFGNRGGHGCSSFGCSRSHGSSSGCSTSNGCSRSHGCSGGLFGGGLFHRNRGCSSASTCSASCGTAVIVEKKAMPKGETVPTPKKGAQNAAPATILVTLPAGARLTVDGVATTSTSDVRTLVTPELAFGSTYVYTMRAEVVQNGNTQTETQQVTVRGGETTAVRFNFSTQTVASR